MAEIATRQRMLDDTGAAASAADLPRAPTQRLPDLEQLLREINTRIETAHPTAIDGAVETLRNDLAEIALMVRDAMPRQAIEALETEIRSLASRIDSQRQDGSDRAAIAVIERGLADIRDSLRTLTPAESLIGFDRTVQGLSQKIDRIADIGQNHPEVLKQLEGAILALRGTIAHVASNDALSQLTKEVRALSGKIDQVSAPEAFSGMERRIAAIADALQQSRNAPIQDAAGLESAVLGLADKVDRLQSTQSDRALIQDLQERIARLAEKLDTSDARLNHLGSIESALADLLVQMERRNPAEANAAGVSANADALKRDVQRTQNSIESLHGTLAQVVDRLAMIEASIAKGAQSRAPATPNVPTQHAPSLRVPLGPELLSSPSITPTQMAGSSADAAFAPRGADRRAIDPTLPPNHPLEPGGQFRAGNSAAERIAASEAALEQVLPQAVSDPGGRSDFIAAARRAAQAAMAAPHCEAQALSLGPMTTRRAIALRRRDPQAGHRRKHYAVHPRAIAFRLEPVLGRRAGHQLDSSGDPGRCAVGTRRKSRTRRLSISSRWRYRPPSRRPQGHRATKPARRPRPCRYPISTPLEQSGSRPCRRHRSRRHPRHTRQRRAPMIPTARRPPAAALACAPPPTMATLPPLSNSRVATPMGAACRRTSRKPPHGLSGPPPRASPRRNSGSAACTKGPRRSEEPRHRAPALHRGGRGRTRQGRCNLADLYAEGVEQATTRWRPPVPQAADHGVADSQYNLAILYARGIASRPIWRRPSSGSRWRAAMAITMPARSATTSPPGSTRSR
jgi:localization factor PodJL